VFRVQGAGFRVQGSGFRVQGSGSRVQCHLFVLGSEWDAHHGRPLGGGHLKAKAIIWH